MDSKYAGTVTAMRMARKCDGRMLWRRGNIMVGGLGFGYMF